MKNVALIYPMTVPWMAQCMKGIQAFAADHGGWALLTSPPTLRGAEEVALTTGDMRGWHGDGIIAYVSDAREAREARLLDIPVVTIGGMLADPGLHRVTVDQVAIGRLGAEHLLECGFKRLAFFGLQGPWYSSERARGFVGRAREADVPCDVFLQPPDKRRVTWEQRLAPLHRWLVSMRPPVGIMAVHDFRARMVIEECQRLGLNVPHDVAVLGVDDNPTICETSHPAISSVSRNAFRHGFETAALLHQVMRRSSPKPREIIIPPDGVVQRRSTDTLAVDDPDIRRAVRTMRERLGEPSGLEHVLDDAQISRRLLESRFQASLHCSPYHYLCRLRVERARMFLEQPGRQPLAAIALLCGFTSAAHLSRVFLRITGGLPSNHRARVQKEGRANGATSKTSKHKV